MMAHMEFHLGQATVIIDDVHGHRETKYDVIAAEPLAIRLTRKLLKYLLKKYGVLGLIAMAASMSAHSPEFNTARHLPLVMNVITSAIATSWKAEVGQALHNFTTGQNVVKTALYTSSATLGAGTTVYSATNEISGTGYVAGGNTVANTTPTTSGTTAIYTWANATWTTATFTANGALWYNTTNGNRAVFTIAFGSDQSVTAGTFTIQMPTADASNAIIRIT